MQPVSAATRVEQRAVLGLDRLERVAGRPAARADDAARRGPAVVEVAAVHLADEVRLGADPRVLDRGQLLARARYIASTTFAAATSGCGVPGGVCSSCVGMPGREIVISAVAWPMCATQTSWPDSSQTTA